MGGAIAARAAEVHAPKLAGLVLSGAALAVDAPPLLVAATRLAGALMPNAAALKLPNGDFSSDPANAAVMDKDELIEQGSAPARTAAGLVDGMRLILARRRPARRCRCSRCTAPRTGSPRRRAAVR